MHTDLVQNIKQEYLTSKELAEVFRLKNYRTIHNWVGSGAFIEGVEYIKMKGVLLFCWPAIKNRLHNQCSQDSQESSHRQKKHSGDCLFNL